MLCGMLVAWHLFGVGSGGRRATAYTLLALVGFELTLNGQALLIVSPPDRFVSRTRLANQLADLRDEEIGPVRVASVGVSLSDLDASLQGLEKTNVNDGFQLQLAADLYENLYSILDPLPAPRFSGQPMDTVVAEFRLGIARSVLDRLSVRYLVSDRGPPIAELEPVDLAGPVRVYRNPSTLPRAYVVPRALLVQEDSRTIAALLSDLDPKLWVTMRDDPLRGAGGDRQPFTPARWRRDRSGHATVNVETSHAGLLVIGTTWMPGWRALLDGRQVPIFRGNHCQQVVPILSPGRHEVELSFTPPWLSEGIGITVGACVGWGLLAVVLIRSGYVRRSLWRRSAKWTEAAQPYDQAHVPSYPRFTGLERVEVFEEEAQTQP
jgi:hypothetical protein